MSKPVLALARPVVKSCRSVSVVKKKVVARVTKKRAVAASVGLPSLPRISRLPRPSGSSGWESVKQKVYDFVFVEEDDQ